MVVGIDVGKVLGRRATTVTVPMVRVISFSSPMALRGSMFSITSIAPASRNTSVSGTCLPASSACLSSTSIKWMPPGSTFTVLPAGNTTCASGRMRARPSDRVV